MSADNGIYILKTNGGKFRVAEACAIDNLDWYKKNDPYNLGVYLRDVFGDSPVFSEEKVAVDFAFEMSKHGWTEYGICHINLDDYRFPEDW